MDDALFISYPRDDYDLHLMVESAAFPVLLVNAEGRIAALNKRAARLFRYDRYELQLEPVDILIPQRLRDANCGLRIARAVSDGADAAVAWEEERGVLPLQGRERVSSLRSESSRFNLRRARSRSLRSSTSPNAAA